MQGGALGGRGARGVVSGGPTVWRAVERGRWGWGRHESRGGYGKAGAREHGLAEELGWRLDHRV